MLRKLRVFGVAIILSIFATVYWGVIASDRYVSEAHIIIQSTDIASGQSFDFSSMFGGVGGNDTDQLLMRDYLLSVDMLEKLDEQLDLRSHYSDTSHDMFSRMWDKDSPVEWFHRYYHSRVNVEYDTDAGVLIIQAQGYDAQTANGIATLLVIQGERYMNAMAHRLADEQVSFLEKQVSDMNDRVLQARRALLDYQNEQNMVSPQGVVENIVGIINTLESQLTTLQTERGVMLRYMTSDSPKIIEVNQKIDAVSQQISKEKQKLASSENSALNASVEEYNRLQINAEFAQDIYKTALISLEAGRVEATRTLKKVSVIQHPTKPQYPLQPERLYNILVFIITVFLLASITNLVTIIIRDHRD